MQSKNLYKKLAAIGILSAAGLTTGVYLTSTQEGVEYYPYYDSVGVLTVCYGHTGKDIEMRQYSEDECVEILAKDLDKAETVVEREVKVKVEDFVKVALIDFVFHKGEGNFKKSTMLTKLNEGRVIEACVELERWTFARGRDCKVRSNNCYGVAKRSLLERDWCKGNYEVVDGVLRKKI